MKIIFQKWFEGSGKNGQQPKPARHEMPSWFQRFPAYVQNEKKFRYTSAQRHNGTAKMCMPMLDAFTAGYVIKLPYDVFVDQTNGHPEVHWRRGPDSLVGNHSLDQIPDEMIPDGYHKIVFKFFNEWSVQLPPGYSALYVQPLNRFDLPFQIISGVVENDEYHVPVAFPFFLKAGFEGVIEAGTPIAQVFPFKRENWDSAFKEYDSNYSTTQDLKFFAKLYRSYKKGAWEKKSYN